MTELIALFAFGVIIALVLWTQYQVSGKPWTWQNIGIVAAAAIGGGAIAANMAGFMK